MTRGSDEPTDLESFTHSTRSRTRPSTRHRRSQNSSTIALCTHPPGTTRTHPETHRQCDLHPTMLTTAEQLILSHTQVPTPLATPENAERHPPHSPINLCHSIAPRVESALKSGTMCPRLVPTLADIFLASNDEVTRTPSSLWVGAELEGEASRAQTVDHNRNKRSRSCGAAWWHNGFKHWWIPTRVWEMSLDRIYFQSQQETPTSMSHRGIKRSGPQHQWSAKSTLAISTGAFGYSNQCFWNRSKYYIPLMFILSVRNQPFSLADVATAGMGAIEGQVFVPKTGKKLVLKVGPAGYKDPNEWECPRSRSFSSFFLVLLTFSRFWL